MTAPTTITWVADWDNVLPAQTVSSRRSTTSSRHPGRQFEGVVHACIAQLVACAKCGTLRRGRGPHAPRWRDGVVVDCAGIPVPALEAQP